MACGSYDIAAQFANAKQTVTSRPITYSRLHSYQTINQCIPTRTARLLPINEAQQINHCVPYSRAIAAQTPCIAQGAQYYTTHPANNCESTTAATLHAQENLSSSVPAAQLAAPLSTAHFSYNGVAKARTEAAAAKAAAANAAAAAEAANATYAALQARAIQLSALADAKASKLQKDLDEIHAAHARIARQTTYPCLGN